MKKKIISLVLVFALALALGIGGTVAWLTATTGEVENTFTVGDIEIELTEDGTDKDGKKNYPFIPGDELAKNPTVTVREGSEDCWVFVKVTETNNTYTGLDGKIINWEDDDWTEVKVQQSGVSVWYKSEPAKAGNTFSILKGDRVTVNQNITEEIAEAIDGDADGENKPQLTFDAFAHQSNNTDVATATAAALSHWSLTAVPAGN